MEPVSGGQGGGTAHDEAVRRARHMVASGALSAAETLLRDITKASPDLPAAWSLLGDVLFFKECFGDAAACYETVLSLDSADQHSFYRLSECLLEAHPLTQTAGQNWQKTFSLDSSSFRHPPRARLPSRARPREREVTIIVPTKDRYEFLRRVLTHLEQQGCGSPVLIADSSDAPDPDLEANFGLDLRVRRFDAAIDPFRKMLAAADLVETEFTVLLADDDFLILDTLDLCIERLEQDPGLSCAAGRVANVRRLRSGRWLLSNYHQIALEQSDPRARLLAFTTLFPPAFYSVKRTGSLIKGLGAGLPFGRYHPLWENLTILMDAIRGRIALVEDLYAVRWEHGGQWSRELDNTLDPILEDPDFPRFFSIFKRQASAAMVSHLGWSEEDADRFIVRTYNHYLACRALPPGPFPHPFVRKVRASGGDGPWLKEAVEIKGRAFEELREVLRQLHGETEIARA